MIPATLAIRHSMLLGINRYNMLVAPVISMLKNLTAGMDIIYFTIKAVCIIM